MNPKELLASLAAVALLGGAVYMGAQKNAEKAKAPAPLPIAPVQPVAPVEPVVPVPPIKPDPVYSENYVKGYKDGYGGAWLAPGHWLASTDYRIGWITGKNDREDGKPNKFDK